MYGINRNGVAKQALTDIEGILLTRNALGDAALQGRLFCAANQTNVTTTAKMATTWTGLGIYNPAGSGKDLVFHEFGWHQEIVMNTEGGIGLFGATSSNAAADITIQGGKFALGSSVAYAEEGCTIASPQLLRTGLGSTMEGAISVVPSLGMNIYNINEGIIMPPGYGLFTYTFAIQTTSILFHFLWEEIDA